MKDGDSSIGPSNELRRKMNLYEKNGTINSMSKPKLKMRHTKKFLAK
jgi:hypothetical protein